MKTRILSPDAAAPLLRWTARIWAAGLVLFWGGFFVAHIAEWYVGQTEWPPLWVTLLCGAHFLLLAGLIAGWRWELAGGLAVVAAALLFFPFAAGRYAPQFLALTLPPGLIWIGLRLIERRRESL